MTADEIIAHLSLAPHPEGGHYRQTWEAEAAPGERSAGTCIYFLLTSGERSHWHKVDAAEIWHFYAGAPLRLSLSETKAGPREDRVLGPALNRGEVPQLIVPEGYWQAAECLGDWTLVGCTVSPGFRFDGFTLAQPGFDIGA
ncbi:cupin domain-containing protein [Litorisediminicola beolgyonensis]|uniref:Cupin domain-containing protein n=1 Tax=Litorisediminicola beolgyonensis TaxID=1173614 RepID=A0ABW3ZF75_9RHOB